jgi:hypothetical protein
MFRVFYLVIVLFGSTLSCSGQTDTSAIKEVVELTSHFSNQENRFELQFDAEKETFIFCFYQGKELLKKLKLIKSDVHPEGIFLYESEYGLSIRFLSIHNGKVFIEEKFVSGFRKGKSTNIADVGDLSHIEKETLLKYVESFKNILSESPKGNQPILISPPRTKN